MFWRQKKRVPVVSVCIRWCLALWHISHHKSLHARPLSLLFDGNYLNWSVPCGRLWLDRRKSSRVDLLVLLALMIIACMVMDEFGGVCFGQRPRASSMVRLALVILADSQKNELFCLSHVNRCHRTPFCQLSTYSRRNYISIKDKFLIYQVSNGFRWLIVFASRT